jgi:hypothetical protein
MAELNGRVLADVLAEYRRQQGEWGSQDIADGTGGDAMLLGRSMLWLRDMLQAALSRAAAEGEQTWALIALCEVFEALAEAPGDPNLRVEVAQVAAILFRWLESIDRREIRLREVGPWAGVPPTAAEVAAGDELPLCADCRRYPVALAGQVCGECADAEDCQP